MVLLALSLCLLLSSSSSGGGSSSVPDTSPLPTDDGSRVSQLCGLLLDKYNTFADMVPLILPITFPADNDYLTGDAEVLFYTAERNGTQCELYTGEDLKLFRMTASLKMTILSNRKRMDIHRCKLEAHLRMDHQTSTMAIRPELVDVSVTGPVFQDGLRLDRTHAEEILRPILVKEFTNLAERYLAYSGFSSSAVFVDPAIAAGLLRQLYLSYMSQL